MQLAATGLAAGLFSGLFGVGGGVVAVPLLILWLGYGEREATGTSLLMITVTALAGVAAQATYGNVHVDDGLLIGIPAVGGVARRDVASAAAPRRARAAAVRAAALGDGGDARGARMIGTLIVGFAAGMLAGLLGIGGGSLFVPALVLLVGLSQVDAEATSLLAIVPVAAVGAWRQHGYGNLRDRGGARARRGGDPGRGAGVAIVNAVPERAVEIGFAALLLWVAWTLAAPAVRELRGGTELGDPPGP